MDRVLNRAGNVMHAIDPARLVTFENGGPPVWSVGMVQVLVPQPYTLFLTYGFSHVFSPEASRQGIHHELSIAVAPHAGNTHVWATSLLGHLARVAADPVIPHIDTRGGPIEVRRIVGITEEELQRLGTIPASRRGAARSALDSLLLSTI